MIPTTKSIKRHHHYDLFYRNIPPGGGVTFPLPDPADQLHCIWIVELWQIRQFSQDSRAVLRREERRDEKHLTGSASEQLSLNN